MVAEAISEVMVLTPVKKHGTHWNYTNAIGVDNWTLVKTAVFSKRASGEVLLRAIMSTEIDTGQGQFLALKVESDKGVEYEKPWAEYYYNYPYLGPNVIATIDVSDVLWLKVYVKKYSTSPAAGVGGSLSYDGGLWFDREVNDIQWV